MGIVKIIGLFAQDAYKVPLPSNGTITHGPNFNIAQVSFSGGHYQKIGPFVCVCVQVGGEGGIGPFALDAYKVL